MALSDLYSTRPHKKMGRSGWLAPDGRFYPCDYAAHARLADVLAVRFAPHRSDDYMISTERRLELASWIKVQWNGHFQIVRMDKEAKPTRKQMNRLHEVTPLLIEKGEGVMMAWARQIAELEERTP